MHNLDGKVAIVTGATSGIGKACAELLAFSGAMVVLIGRNRKNGTAIEESLRLLGYKAQFVSCDVTDEAQVAGMVKKVIQDYDKIDIVFNNAGILPLSVELEQLDFESWKKIFDVNINSYFLVIKHSKQFLQKSKGVILNNASIAGMHSCVIGRSYAYSASKSAVIQFTRMMAKNYATDGIRVNAISPGIIETPMMHDRNLLPYIEKIPMKRLGTTEDVTKAVLFLVSDEASYITGINLVVDGGISL
jgi:NAD(P)-dependent dehydrogenase (short-subunit alcohol dehydrogenase family)